MPGQGLVTVSLRRSILGGAALVLDMNEISFRSQDRVKLFQGNRYRQVFTAGNKPQSSPKKADNERSDVTAIQIALKTAETLEGFRYQKDEPNK